MAAAEVAEVVVAGVVVLEEVEEVASSKETLALQNLLQVSFRISRNLPLCELLDLVHSGPLNTCDLGLT